MGRSIPKWKSVKCQHASQWSFCVCLHTDMALAIRELCMDEDRHWTVKELPEHVGISESTVLKISQWDLKVHKIGAK